MGLSPPFKGSFSKFLIIYGAVEQEQWLLALVCTLASIIAAVYYLHVIQRVCLEKSTNCNNNLKTNVGSFSWSPTTFLILFLTLLTILLSIEPEPFVHIAQSFATQSSIVTLPEFETPWAPIVLVPPLPKCFCFMSDRLLFSQIPRFVSSDCSNHYLWPCVEYK